MKRKLTLQDKAFIALKKAVHDVVEHHRRTGRPLAIWRDGKVALVSPNRILRKSR